MNDNSKVQLEDIVNALCSIRLIFPSAYPTENEIAENALIQMFYKMFAQYDRRLFYEAVKMAIEQSEFYPKPATIKAAIEKLTSKDDKSELELWAELDGVLADVYRISQHLIYEKEAKQASAKLAEIYNALSADIRLYVINVADLISLSSKTAEELNYEKGRFLKMLPELKQKKADRMAAQNFMRLMGEQKKLLKGE